jgi:hypothetical protein
VQFQSSCKLLSYKVAEVAQLVEQPIRNRQVPGSSPGLGSILEDPGPDHFQKDSTSAERNKPVNLTPHPKGEIS